MKIQIYCLHDTVSDTHALPQFAINDATAVRNCKDALLRDEQLARHANDYKLVGLGEYDDTTGVITGLEKPRHIISVAALLPQEK